jgi:hypothetical protein
MIAVLHAFVLLELLRVISLSSKARISVALHEQS